MAYRATLLGLAAAALVFSGAGAGAQISTNARQAMLVDHDTGDILFCKDCTVQMPPSSMSKLMTTELVFQRLKDGRLKPEDTFHVSETAWRQGQKTNESKMWVALNSNVSVDNLLKGIIVQSGGDACLVVAEALGGSEAGFAELQNARAKELGLEHSHFTNSSGMPDPEHYMSASDLVKLSSHLIRDYPEYYKYFAIKEFTWSNIRQPNRLSLINENIGVDGLKTGHTDASGYGLIASSLRSGRRLIVVVNGLTTIREREAEARRLLDMGYREFRSYELAKAGDTIAEADVWGGPKERVALTVKEPLKVVMAADARRNMKVTLRYDGPVRTPIAMGQQVGTFTVAVPGKPDTVVPAIAAEAVGGGDFLDRMMRGLQALIMEATKS